MKLHTMLKAGVGAALMTLFVSAQAAAYCSAPGPHPDGLDVSNMTINMIAATDCYGPGSMGNNATSTTTSTVNGLAWGGGFTFLARNEAGDTSDTGTFQGIQFTLSTGSIGQTSGTFTLTAIDTNPGAGVDLPATFDLVGVLKGGTPYAAYFFDDLTINPGSNGGTYTIAFTNNGGNFPGLSHIDFLIRGGTNIRIPEPATAGLLGLGLLGLMGARRRKHGKSV